LEYKVDELTARIETVSSPQITGMPRGGQHKTKEDLIAEKIETEERIVKLKSRGRIIRREILDYIDDIEDENIAETLEMFFIDGLTLEDIADEKGYSTRYIATLYSKGIEMIDEKKRCDFCQE
jgi:hypothetical protein